MTAVQLRKIKELKTLLAIVVDPNAIGNLRHELVRKFPKNEKASWKEYADAIFKQAWELICLKKEIGFIDHNERLSEFKRNLYRERNG